jgi:hypothetical protein
MLNQEFFIKQQYRIWREQITAAGIKFAELQVTEYFANGLGLREVSWRTDYLNHLPL